jgi:hypothetical protein
MTRDSLTYPGRLSSKRTGTPDKRGNLSGVTPNGRPSSVTAAPGGSDCTFTETLPAEGAREGAEGEGL